MYTEREQAIDQYKSNRVCHQFRKIGSCTYGGACKFQHVREQKKVVAAAKASATTVPVDYSANAIPEQWEVLTSEHSQRRIR